MGQLASSLSHELSQPLATTAVNVMAGRLHLRAEKPDVEELGAILDDIGNAHSRAGEILDRMRQLFKRREIEMQSIKVEDVVNDVLALVRSETQEKNVTLRTVIAPEFLRVLGDRVHITQVLLNLVMNGIQAVQSLSPECRSIVIQARLDNAKGEVEIAVQDTGPGISAVMANNLFKPFFTTKAEGT